RESSTARKASCIASSTSASLGPTTLATALWMVGASASRRERIAARSLTLLASQRPCRGSGCPGGVIMEGNATSQCGNGERKAINGNDATTHFYARPVPEGV